MTTTDELLNEENILELGFTPIDIMGGKITTSENEVGCHRFENSKLYILLWKIGERKGVAINIKYGYFKEGKELVAEIGTANICTKPEFLLSDFKELLRLIM